MDERTTSIFNDSLERCTQDPRFLKRFYELFLSSDPRVAKYFEHTDFSHQNRMLRRSLYIMMLAGQDNAAALEEIGAIARRHGPKDLGITVYMYELWLESLCQVVRELDPHATEATVAAWASVMRHGIALMLEGQH